MEPLKSKLGSEALEQIKRRQQDPKSRAVDNAIEAQKELALLLIQQWKSDKNLRAEFGKFRNFIAYSEAHAAGRIRI